MLQVFSHCEYYPGLVQINPHDVTNKLTQHKFDDDKFGFTPRDIVLDEQAHETMDDDGTLYCSHMVYTINGDGTVSQWCECVLFSSDV